MYNPCESKYTLEFFGKKKKKNYMGFWFLATLYTKPSSFGQLNSPYPLHYMILSISNFFFFFLKRKLYIIKAKGPRPDTKSRYGQT